MVVKPPAPRILFASWSHDPFVEAIEQQLALAVKSRHGQFLRVVEGRRPADDGIPTIDLAEAVRVTDDPSAVRQPPPACLSRIVDDTTWFEETAGLRPDRTKVESRLSQVADHAGRILASFRPHAVLVWNGMLSQRAVIASLAREAEIPVWYCERGALPGSWYADPIGINGGSSLVQDPLPPRLHQALSAPLDEDQVRLIRNEIDANARAGASAWGQPPLKGAKAWRKKLNIPPEACILFFPLQVDADTNMRFFSPHFGSSLDALRAICNACHNTHEWFILAKPHPKGNCPPELVTQTVGTQGGCVADINLHDAIELATLVVTINSTVAVEAAWSNKPVLQLGCGALSGKGIVSEYDPATPMAAQLADAIQLWVREPIRFDRVLRLYSFLRESYLLQATDPDSATAVLDHVCGKVAARHTNDPMSPHELARQYAWRPAVEIIRRLASRDPRTRRIILLGYGQNAMRLVHTARLLNCWNDWEWTVWDDSAFVRQQAEIAGLTWIDPWRGETHDGNTIVIVTPDNATAIETRLREAGRIEGRDWLRLR